MTILEKTKGLFANVRKSILEAMAALYEVHESKAWEQEYSSFSEFVEDGLQISRGFASRLLTIHKHYVVDGGVSHRKLEDIDPNKLYLAAALKMPIEEQLLRASSWTMGDIKAELAVKDGKEHECVPVTICKICNARLIPT